MKKNVYGYGKHLPGSRSTYLEMKLKKNMYGYGKHVPGSRCTYLENNCFSQNLNL